jgi:hypothetical protein
MTQDSNITPDIVEARRLAMLVSMPLELAAKFEAGEKVWDTQAMSAEFEVIGFSAPLVVVKRREDGAVGTLQFTHAPRFYFGWQVDAR